VLEWDGYGLDAGFVVIDVLVDCAIVEEWDRILAGVVF
jgi:hypothetical protein